MEVILRETDYALRALLKMAKDKNLNVLSVRAISRSQNIPKIYLRKIFQVLSRAKLVAAERGRKGGYRLSKPLGKISLLQIIECLQGPLSLNRCLSEDRICDFKDRCIIKKKMIGLERNLNKMFRTATLDYLLPLRRP